MPSLHQSVPQLRRRRLGVIHLVFFTVAASAPLTVLGGGVTTTFAVTGDPGVPLSFLVLAVALGLFAVGYAAMSRHVANAGAFYSYLAKGLGPVWGVGGAFVALISYNTMQIGLYGLFGAGFADFAASSLGIDPAVVRLGLRGARRRRHPRGAARRPQRRGAGRAARPGDHRGRPSTTSERSATPRAARSRPWGSLPGALFGPGVGAVFAFGIAAFVGFESGAIYSEECRNPRVTVARATFVALGFTGLFYALSSWAMAVTVGPENLQAAATENGPGLVFAGARGALGPGRRATSRTCCS